MPTAVDCVQEDDIGDASRCVGFVAGVGVEAIQEEDIAGVSVETGSDGISDAFAGVCWKAGDVGDRASEGFCSRLDEIPGDFFDGTVLLR